MVKKKKRPLRRAKRRKTRGSNLGHPRDKSPLFMVADKKKTVEIKDGEKIDIQVICPMCHTYWADATVVYGGNVTPESFRLKEPYTAMNIEVGYLSCPACFYNYSNWAVMALVMAAMNRQAITSKLDGGLSPVGKIFPN